MSVNSRGGRSRCARRVGFTTVALVAVIANTAKGAVATPSAQARLAQTGVSLAASPAAGHILGGLTAQGGPVVFGIANNGKRIVGAVAALQMRCTSGLDFTGEDAWFALPIRPNGSVQAQAAVSDSSNSGTTVTGTHSLTGRLDRRRAILTGVWELRLNFAMSGGQTDQCYSGRVAFRVRL